MITYPSAGQEQVVYQADSTVVENVGRIRERLQPVVRQFVNRRVRIQTIDGRAYEGVIVNVDGCFIYLQTQHPAVPYRLFNPFYYSSVILPLVLYELLVITLLYT